MNSSPCFVQSRSPVVVSKTVTSFGRSPLVIATTRRVPSGLTTGPERGPRPLHPVGRLLEQTVLVGAGVWTTDPRARRARRRSMSRAGTVGANDSPFTHPWRLARHRASSAPGRGLVKHDLRVLAGDRRPSPLGSNAISVTQPSMRWRPTSDRRIASVRPARRSTDPPSTGPAPWRDRPRRRIPSLVRGRDDRSGRRRGRHPSSKVGGALVTALSGLPSSTGPPVRSGAHRRDPTRSRSRPGRRCRPSIRRRRRRERS